MWKFPPLSTITPLSPVSIPSYLHAPLFPHRHYLSKADLDVLDNAEEYLSGRKKQQLTDWWLQYIEDGVEKYLQQKGYDQSCVPYQYLDKPPSSLARLQDNIRIVRHILSELGNQRQSSQYIITPTIAYLVNPIKKDVYEKLDALCNDVKLVLWDKINTYGCRMDYQHITSLRNFAFMEEAYLHLNSIRQLISPAESKGLQELMDDIVYINEVRKLDESFFDTPLPSSSSSSSSSGPSDIVPITGLIVNRIHRLENELKTVLDHWRGRMM